MDNSGVELSHVVMFRYWGSQELSYDRDTRSRSCLREEKVDRMSDKQMKQGEGDEMP